MSETSDLLSDLAVKFGAKEPDMLDAYRLLTRGRDVALMPDQRAVGSLIDAFSRSNDTAEAVLRLVRDHGLGQRTGGMQSFGADLPAGDLSLGGLNPGRVQSWEVPPGIPVLIDHDWNRHVGRVTEVIERGAGAVTVYVELNRTVPRVVADAWLGRWSVSPGAHGHNGDPWLDGTVNYGRATVTEVSLTRYPSLPGTALRPEQGPHAAGAAGRAYLESVREDARQVTLLHRAAPVPDVVWTDPGVGFIVGTGERIYRVLPDPGAA